METKDSEKDERDLRSVEDILGEMVGTHADYRRGAAVALAEVAREMLVRAREEVERLRGERGKRDHEQ